MIQQMTAAAAGTITLGGDLIVNRLGYGAMRITGKGICREGNELGPELLVFQLPDEGSYGL